MPPAPEADYLRLALEIAGGELTPGGHLRLRVVGDSMAPLLRPGDAVIVRPTCAENLQRGDVVAVRRGGQVISHRVVEVGGGRWRTKGDNSHRLDPQAPGEALVGQVIAIERGADRLDLRSGRWQVASRFLGLAGAWEAALFRQGEAMGSLRSSALAAGLARLLTGPFTLLRKALYYANAPTPNPSPKVGGGESGKGPNSTESDICR